MRLMTASEEADLRVRVARALQPSFATSLAIVKRPITLAIAWPTLGIVLLGAQILYRRGGSKRRGGDLKSSVSNG
jgi:hypothetical protein